MPQLAFAAPKKRAKDGLIATGVSHTNCGGAFDQSIGSELYCERMFSLTAALVAIVEATTSCERNSY